MKDRKSSERQKEKIKTLSIGQPSDKTMIELLLKYKYQDWMLEEEHRNFKIEILLFLNLEFLFICLFVCFVSCCLFMPLC
jgi:hypothetical protein